MTIQPTGPSNPRIEGALPTRSTNGVARVSDETQLRQSEAPATGQRDVLDLSPAARARVARSDEDGSLFVGAIEALKHRGGQQKICREMRGGKGKIPLLW